MQVAGTLGFSVPPTVVTGRRGLVEEFLGREPGEVVCKPLWDGKLGSIDAPQALRTKLFNSQMLDDLGPEPFIFQRRIRRGCDVRVIVTGRKVYAVGLHGVPGCIVDHREVDFALTQEPERLPDAISDACLRLMSHYGLQYGAVDLIRDPAGEYHFLELNVSGRWAWLEQQTGLPLRAGIVSSITST